MAGAAMGLVLAEGSSRPGEGEQLAAAGRPSKGFFPFSFPFSCYF